VPSTSGNEQRPAIPSDWVFASSNPHKLREVLQILAPLGVSIRHLGEFGSKLVEPVEDGVTFEANAELKARSYAAQTGCCCLAEDSGLEVDALGGAPGVYSARYSGEEGPREVRDQLNNEKLLRELEHVPDAKRAARFVCTLCLVAADGSLLATARGTYEGVIAREPRGQNGFGYDPLLWLPDRGCTSAELSPAEKNARSHRGNALRELLGVLAARPVV
jgi:XTP/dITP diphosphohydrolase